MKRSPVIPLAHILGSLWQRESVPVIETFVFASSRLGFEAQPGVQHLPPQHSNPGLLWVSEEQIQGGVLRCQRS